MRGWRRSPALVITSFQPRNPVARESRYFSSGASSDENQEAPPRGEHENLSGASMEVLSTMYRSHPSQRFILTRREGGEMRNEEGWEGEEGEDDEGDSGGRPRGKPVKEHQIAAWRRYLSHPGVPDGTVFEREVMAGKMRLNTAQNRVHKHKMRALGVVDDDVKVGEQEGSLRPQKGMMAVVEDKIQISMMQGDFEDLQGRGKPLERDRTPGLDRTTDIFMDVLRRNGVKPEWIERQNRIADMTALLKQRIRTEYALALLDANPHHDDHHHHVNFNDSTTTAVGGGSAREEGGSSHEESSRRPLAQPCMERFRDRVHGLASVREDLDFLNKEIDMYNLQVPSLHLQRLRIKMDQLIGEATWTGIPFTLEDAEQMYRTGAREGLMGVTCLIEYRAHHFDDHEDDLGRSRKRGPSASFTPYWLEDGGGARGRSRRRGPRSLAEENPLVHAVMIPIDGIARYLARVFSI